MTCKIRLRKVWSHALYRRGKVHHWKGTTKVFSTGWQFDTCLASQFRQQNGMRQKAKLKWKHCYIFYSVTLLGRIISRPLLCLYAKMLIRWATLQIIVTRTTALHIRTEIERNPVPCIDRRGTLIECTYSSWSDSNTFWASSSWHHNNL